MLVYWSYEAGEEEYAGSGVANSLSQFGNVILQQWLGGGTGRAGVGTVTVAVTAPEPLLEHLRDHRESLVACDPLSQSRE